MDDKNRALDFLQQLIDINVDQDIKNRKEFDSGDSWIVFNLKLLKNLIEKI